ncbi:MAG: hypothetical protein HRU33_09925 [Rhodobacteraceae bacterium]|nr:hypothetical protein [Paracoccaceae bacterium]
MKFVPDPEHPAELVDHSLIDFTHRDIAHAWTYPGKRGPPISFAIDPRTRCNDAEMERSLAIAETVIIRLAALICSDDIRAGRLVRLLADFEPKPAGVNLVYPNREHLPRKTRVMVDSLVERSAHMKR